MILVDDNATSTELELAVLAHTREACVRAALRQATHQLACVAFVCYDIPDFVRALRHERCVWDAEELLHVAEANGIARIPSLAFKICALHAHFNPGTFHARECLFSMLLAAARSDRYVQRAVACGLQLWVGDLLRWRSASAETVFHRLAASPSALDYLHLFAPYRAHALVAAADGAGRLPMHVARDRTDLEVNDHAVLCQFFQSPFEP